MKNFFLWDSSSYSILRSKLCSTARQSLLFLWGSGYNYCVQSYLNLLIALVVFSVYSRYLANYSEGKSRVEEVEI
jgi:hypothetical protein